MNNLTNSTIQLNLAKMIQGLVITSESMYKIYKCSGDKEILKGIEPIEAQIEALYHNLNDYGKEQLLHLDIVLSY